MKSNFFLVLTFLFLLGGITQGQIPDRQVIRVMPCSLNPGYSMDEVVTLARAYDFGQHAPDAVYFREALYVGTGFAENYDFTVAFFYPSYSELIRRRGAQRATPTSSSGLLARDMMTCGTPRLLNSHTANQGADLLEPLTVMMNQRCELNGKTLADAIRIGATVANNFAAEGLNPHAAVDVRTYGGNTINTNEQVFLRFVPPTAAEAGKMNDLILDGFNFTQGIGSDSRLSCTLPNFWLSHRIFVRDSQ